MKASITVAAALIFCTAAPVSSAFAYPYGTPYERSARGASFEGAGHGHVGSHDRPMFGNCPASSASEGNANQQNFPVKQYGQTSGGPLC